MFCFQLKPPVRCAEIQLASNVSDFKQGFYPKLAVIDELSLLT